MIIEMIAAAVVEHVNECQQPQQERLISATEAARRLNMSRRSLDRQRGAFPFVKPRASGHGYDVVASKLAEWIAGH